VLDQFKKGVERSIAPEDSNTHYDLGIAYKEMGLLDEALGEFRTALGGNNQAREVDVLTMLGLCHGMKGQHREAVAAFQQALGSAHVTPEAETALRFEIGSALEALGERDQALGYFQAIARTAGSYRDVAARVARLGGGVGRPPAEAGPAATPDEPGRPPVRRGPKKNIGFV
jgi:pilus assembly protein FimV